MTTLPPPGEPEIYEALLTAMVQASETTRVANAAYAAALQPLRQAMEMAAREAGMLDRLGELSDRAHAASRDAIAMANQGGVERMRQAETLFEQAAALRREAAVAARQINFSAQQASALMLQGIEASLAASEEHRIGLERATSLLQQVRRRQSNGDTPEAQAA